MYIKGFSETELRSNYYEFFLAFFWYTSKFLMHVTSMYATLKCTRAKGDIGTVL